MLNQWTGLGRLTKDPELRTTTSGIAVASFTLAIDRDYKDRNGDKLTDFVSVTAWRSTAAFVQKYFHKGQLACVTGSLQSDKWVDDQGNNRVSWKIVADNVYFAGSRPADSSGEPPPLKEPEFTDLTDDEASGELPF